MTRPVLDRVRFPALLLGFALGVCGALAAEEPVLSPLAEANEETRALVAKAVLGYGGESKIGSVSLLHVTAKIVQDDSDGKFRMTIESFSSFPNRHLARIHTAQGTMTIALDGPDAYLIPARAAVRGAAIRLTLEEREDLVRYFVSDPLFVLRDRRSSRFLFAAGANETVDSIECQRLHVYADGMSVVWIVDLATGRIVRTEVGEERSDFSEWKVSGPLTVPHRVSTTRGEKVISETSYTAYEINPRTYDSTSQLRKPDLWLMRWKVQPKPGRGYSVSGSVAQSEVGATKSAATYRPPAIEVSDASVMIWDPSSGAVP